MKYITTQIYKHHFRLIILIVLLISLKIDHVEAQTPETPWQDPTIIFQGSGQILYPAIVADQYGYVHVFWRYDPTTDPIINETDLPVRQLYYSRWNGESWSNPVDIVATPALWYLSAATGLNGEIYLIWTETNGDLYFSQANIDEAVDINCWSKPVILAQAGQHPQILIDSTGVLYIVFVDNGSGVSYLRSNNKGISWSMPYTISPSSASDTVASEPYFAFSDNGIMHSVWTELQLPEGWPPVGVFYSRSLDEGKTWSQAVKIDSDGYDQINITTGRDGIVHLAWNGMAGVGGRYHRVSNNDGESWSATETIAENGATDGAPSMIIDNSGTIHFFSAHSGAYYQTLINGIWSVPILLSAQESPDAKFIEDAKLSLNLGNKLHAVYWVDHQRLWYTTKQVDSTRELIVQLPMRSLVEPTNTELLVITQAIPSPDPSPTYFVSEPEKLRNSSGPGLIFLVSILPVILLIGGIVLIRINRDRMPF